MAMDAAFLVVAALNAAGIGATAYPQVPGTRPASFLVVERTGGSDANRVQSTASVDVDCWADTAFNASELAGAVRDALLALPDSEPNVFHVSITSTYNNPDIDSGSPRYTVGADLTVNR